MDAFEWGLWRRIDANGRNGEMMGVERTREARKVWGGPQVLCGAPAVSERMVFGTYSRERHSLDGAMLLRVRAYVGKGTAMDNIDKGRERRYTRQ